MSVLGSQVFGRALIKEICAVLYQFFFITNSVPSFHLTSEVCILERQVFFWMLQIIFHDISPSRKKKMFFIL